MNKVSRPLDVLRKRIRESRAASVPRTPEKYPLTRMRGLTILEAEAVLAAVEQLIEANHAAPMCLFCREFAGHRVDCPFIPFQADTKEEQ